MSIFPKHILTFFVGLLCVSLVYSQKTINNIDSALVVLKKLPADTSKAILYQEIGGHYNVTQLDSALPFFKKGFQLSKSLKYSKGQWINLNGIGNYFERKTAYDSALVYYNNALKIIKKTNSTKGFAIVLNNIATINIRTGAYQKALEFLFEALRAEEKLKNQNGISQAYNNIGVVYYYIQDFDKATSYLTEALNIQESLGNYDGLQNGYNNVGAIFDYQKKYDEAIKSYRKALDISIQLGDVKQEASFLNNIALSYSQKGDYTEATKYFDKSLKIKDIIKDYNGIALGYLGFGQMFLSQKKYNEASNYINKGVLTAKKHKILKVQAEGIAAQSEIAGAIGNHKLANELLYQYIAIKDSLLNENNAKAMAEIETKYETEKKEKEIVQQRAKLIEGELQSRKKNTWIVGGFSLALLAGLLGFLFYNQQKLKNQQLLKEKELNTALTKIDTQNKLQEQRLRISRDLHDNIGAQLTFIISSIDNIKFGFPDLQEKLSQKLEGISSFSTQTIYELRDTIWAMNKEFITTDDLNARITNFINQAKTAAQGINFRFKTNNISEQEVKLPSVVGMNVYRITQEAVNNAIKYAQSTNIEVIFSKSTNSYKVAIKDNGKGFNMAEAPLGNGLNNMKKRARDINAQINMNSKIGEGTEIILKFEV